MASEALWTQAAEEDREAIVKYLIDLRGGVQAASHFLDEIDEAVIRISAFPEMHALSHDAYLSWLGIRVCPFMNYLMLYQVDDENVILMRIFHGSQDYARLV